MNNCTGKNKVFATLGATNHSLSEREPNDYYATDPKALELILERFKKDNIILNNKIWEPACGGVIYQKY